MAPDAITIQDIRAARARIAPPVRHTPLLPAPSLSAIAGGAVYLKLETTQDTRAFKLRGAMNKLLSLSDDERRRGVVTVSSGNHGRGIAYAARQLDMRAVICVGSLVPRNKIDNMRALGAEVRVIGDSQDEALVEVERLVAEQGMVPAHPFDDPHVIAGQGTIGLELVDDLPDLETVIVPLSGGGLIGGIALALKASAPGIRVIGVSMERGAAMIESLKAGKPVPVEELPTLADALGGGIGLDNRWTFGLVRDLVDATLTVTEAQIARAMGHLFRAEQLVVEGAGAVGVAALLEGRVPAPGGKTAVVLSGANVDMDDFMAIVTGPAGQPGAA